ncbi:MAG: AraC family transcriptional regulator [Bacillota bacterium]
MNYYYDSILKAADYIEKSLTSSIDLSDIIKNTGFSQFHFMRVFKAVVGYTISEYVRRRKMTEAAKLLMDTGMKIIDIAVLFGYNSQEAFSRAFKEVFNVPPNLFRKDGKALRNLEQLVLTKNLLKFKAEIEVIEPLIIEKDSFLLVGMEYRGNNSNYEIPKLWNKFRSRISKINCRVNHNVTYGFEDTDENTNPGDLRYLAGIEVSNIDCIPDNMVIRKVEKSSYAVFPIKAIVDSIPKSIRQIYTVYIPNQT